MTIQTNIPLSDIAYYRIGGMAKTFIDVSSIEDIKQALIYCQQHMLSPIRVLGLGCNLLLPDDPLDGAVLHMQTDKQSLVVTEDMITAFAGTILDEVIQFAFAHSLSGLAWAGGLPSTVGGAVRG